MKLIPNIKVNISVVIGSTHIPIRQLLKMGRGAVIGLSAKHNDPVEIYANDELFARGQIVVTGNRIHIEVTEALKSNKPAPALAAA